MVPINMNTVFMILNLTHVRIFHGAVNGAALLCMLTIEKNILVTGENPTQGLDGATDATRKAEYPIIFLRSRRRFVLSLHYNGSNSFLFVNIINILPIKSKSFRYKTISIVFSQCFKRIVYFFSFFCFLYTNDILDIHK